MQILMTVDTDDSVINGMLAGFSKLGYQVIGWNPNSSLEDELYKNDYDVVILHNKFVTDYIISLCDKYKLKFFKYTNINNDTHQLTRIKIENKQQQSTKFDLHHGVHDNFVPNQLDSNKTSDFLLISNYTLPQNLIDNLPQFSKNFNLKIVGRNYVDTPEYLGQVTPQELMPFIGSTKILIDYDNHYTNECEYYKIPYYDYIELKNKLDYGQSIKQILWKPTGTNNFQLYSEILPEILDD